MSLLESIGERKTYEEFRKTFYDELHVRTKTGMSEKAKAGDFPGCASLGYKNAWDGQKKVVVIDEGKAPLIIEAFEIAVQGASLGAIIKELTPRGLLSRNGKPLGLSSLHLLLTNPFYTGKIRYAQEVLPGNHEALVNEALFLSVKNELARKRKSRPEDSHR